MKEAEMMAKFIHMISDLIPALKMRDLSGSKSPNSNINAFSLNRPGVFGSLEASR